jgi:hypothetical protein
MMKCPPSTIDANDEPTGIKTVSFLYHQQSVKCWQFGKAEIWFSLNQTKRES